MLLTTILLFVAMREVWRWNLALSTFVAGVFFCVEAVFAAANLLKVAEGGGVPSCFRRGVRRLDDLASGNDGCVRASPISH